MALMEKSPKAFVSVIGPFFHSEYVLIIQFIPKKATAHKTARFLSEETEFVNT